MDDPGDPNNIPKGGKVNKMCREWLVREDGAFAYHLQAHEISQHYTGNKSRNAQVREDFPCALDEQIREQHLAEQAAAVYQKMLSEQEELDKELARQLAQKLEREEQLKRRALEVRDENIARQIMHKEKEHAKQNDSLSSERPSKSTNSPRRKAPVMPLPNYRELHTLPQNPLLSPQNSLLSTQNPLLSSQNPLLSTQNSLLSPQPNPDYQDLYTEPYQPQETSFEDPDHIGIHEDEAQHHRHFSEESRQSQEQRDAEYARALQDQERNSEESLMNRDRMLAIEAQDKELAKLLQERERAKAKRAKERAKQKALAKKLQMEQAQSDILLPEDSYSNPADILPAKTTLPHSALHSTMPTSYNQQHARYVSNNPHDIVEDTYNYTLPVDTISADEYPHEQAQQPSYPAPVLSKDRRQLTAGLASDSHYPEVPPPVRPTQLDIRSPHTQKLGVKPRLPDPISYSTSPPRLEHMYIAERHQQQPKLATTSSRSHDSHHTNIAMAIDPTYTRRAVNANIKGALNSNSNIKAASNSNPNIKGSSNSNPNTKGASNSNPNTKGSSNSNPNLKGSSNNSSVQISPLSSPQSPPSYDISMTSTTGTVTTSTSSSSSSFCLGESTFSAGGNSPAKLSMSLSPSAGATASMLLLDSPGHEEHCDDDDDDTSPAPPYMPIQGQRRTASLEKKQKKKNKDGCKQQ